MNRSPQRCDGGDGWGQWLEKAGKKARPNTQPVVHFSAFVIIKQANTIRPKLRSLQGTAWLGQLCTKAPRACCTYGDYLPKRGRTKTNQDSLCLVVTVAI